MRARLALLEGEKRATDNVKSDLLRRVKMLEYALRQERAKFIALSNPRSTSPKSANSGESNGDKNASGGGNTNTNTTSNTNASAIHPTKKATLKFDGDDSQKSDDSPDLSSSNTLLNHSHNNSSLPQWLKSSNHAKDTKTRSKSRQYLQQCLEEITYLTDPSTLNPLTGRPYKDVDGLEIEKLPHSVPMESTSPNSSEKINQQLSNSLSNSVTIDESSGGPIVSHPIVENEESVRAQLATPSGPSSPPVIASNIFDQKAQEMQKMQTEPEEHDDDEDDQDDQTVIDQDNDANDKEEEQNGDENPEAEATFTPVTHSNDQKDTTKTNETIDEDAKVSKEQLEEENLVKPEDPMNADAPSEAKAEAAAEKSEHSAQSTQPQTEGAVEPANHPEDVSK